eukprot:gnl/TRDRNA2_/TRDRNA2_146225_c0_seq1.p1 gnl/TRDRNA2_/TRDRNA2_146225_c0~~gnl/TRDRNA2_/TRDRNA2_146225_c0_seq1.p1  ORF type:complete len:174 (+),score=24.08 gnl/TRDRNA2_/TRDRNA2_146225_c0_seq1:3-524(+)
MTVSPPVDFLWYLLNDDDNFVLPRGLVALVSDLDPTMPSVMGHVGCKGICGGAGILFSRGATEKLGMNSSQTRSLIPVEFDYLDITVVKLITTILDTKVLQAYPKMNSLMPTPNWPLSEVKAAATLHYVCCNIMIYKFDKCILLNEVGQCNWKFDKPKSASWMESSKKKAMVR